jgi:hypothetical protein
VRERDLSVALYVIMSLFIRPCFPGSLWREEVPLGGTGGVHVTKYCML